MRHVKSPPGSIRAEQAAVTRSRIADAARSLFAERGYAATTLKEIAEAAGVAVQTVYAVFGSKSEILAELRRRIVHDPTADAAYVTALEAADPARALEHFARSIRTRWERGHDVVAIDRDAASAEAPIREARLATLSRRREGIARLAKTVSNRPGSAPAERIAAVIDALTLPEVYSELVDVHGWSPDDYEAWLATSLRGLVGARGGNDP